MSKINLHLISDSTGETLSLITKAAISQFQDVKIKEYIWPLIRTEVQLERLLPIIKEKHGIVFFTLSEKTLVREVRSFCKQNNILCLDVLEGVLDKLASFLKQDPHPTPGGQHVFDRHYFEKIEAINFTMAHDDGLNQDRIYDADIVLIGPSRTSKTPTSAYLAHKGFKTANIPYVANMNMDIKTDKITNTLIMGLTISPERLIEIRKNRLFSMGEKGKTSYIDQEQVEEEIIQAKRFCQKHGWQVIDVTNKSVEEISARIIQIYYEEKRKK